jgi:hypothetical protein
MGSVFKKTVTRPLPPDAEIIERKGTRLARWRSTKSYPFEPPASGKIAVKVINHYGNEVLKVYKV